MIINIGTKEIVSAIDSILNLSENIKNNENKISENIERINSKMENFVSFFNSTINSMELQNKKIIEFFNNVENFYQKVSENSVFINRLKEELNKIQI